MVVRINKLDTSQFSFARQFNIALKLLQTVFNGSDGRVFLLEFVQTGKEVTCSIGHVIFVMY